MKISQPERGGNGVRTAVVNQTFPKAACLARRITGISARLGPALSRDQTTCCSETSLGADFRSGL